MQVDDDLSYPYSKRNGLIQKMSLLLLGELLKDNEEAYKLFMKNKITKAVKRYNKSNHTVIR